MGREPEICVTESHRNAWILGDMIALVAQLMGCGIGSCEERARRAKEMEILGLRAGPAYE